MTVNEIGKILAAQGVFTGGPPELFESAGRLQISTLIREGLNPDSKLLDVGCGCLRAGYWLLRLFDSGCYFWIEPNQQKLEAGIKNCLTSQLVLERNLASTPTTDSISPSLASNSTWCWRVPFGVMLPSCRSKSCWTASSQIAPLALFFLRPSFRPSCGG